MSQRLARQAAATTEARSAPAADPATTHEGCLAAITALEAALLRAEQRADRAEADLRAVLERRHDPGR
jgi:hypothetical protein